MTARMTLMRSPWIAPDSLDATAVAYYLHAEMDVTCGLYLHSGLALSATMTRIAETIATHHVVQPELL